ncbi:CDP-archaeol synthase [Enterococcus saccharolyticus]|nr:CDP-archaeol synthase [Enterococcus saccharolyticus]
MAVIFAGVANMVFCKLPIARRFTIPMDGGKTLSDGKRLFGENKTWKGFIGMMILGSLSQIIWGLCLTIVPSLEQYNLFYAAYKNVWQTNSWIGLLLGFAYVLFELPNSFMKRRLDIRPGKTAENRWKWLFVFIDQADSLLGCALVVALLVPITWQQFLGIILVGSGTHIIVNQVLFRFHLRKNPF